MEKHLDYTYITAIFSKLPVPVIVYQNPLLDIAFISEQMLAITGTESKNSNKSFFTIFPQRVQGKFQQLLSNLWKNGGRATIRGVSLQFSSEPNTYDFDFDTVLDDTGSTTAIIQSTTLYPTPDRFAKQELKSSVDSEITFEAPRMRDDLEEILQPPTIDNDVSIAHVSKSSLVEPNAKDYEDNALKMRLAIESADLGTWSINIETSEVFWDARTRSLYGHPSDETVPYSEVLSYIHEEDRPLVDQAVNYALTPSSNGIYDAKFKTIGAKDGILRWLHARGRALFNNEGRAILFTGVVDDITQTVTTQDKIDEYHRIIALKERKLQLIVDSAQVGTFTFDLHTSSIQLNDYSKKLFPVAATKDQNYDDYDVEALQIFAEAATECIKQSIENNTLCDESFQVKDTRTKKVRWLRLVGRAVLDANGKEEKFYGLVIDISKQKEEERKKLSFLGLASHELRTPLTSLSAYLQILERKIRKDDRKSLLTIIQNATMQANKIKDLTETFLDVVQIDQGKLHLQIAKTSVSELLTNLKTSYHGLTSHILRFKSIEIDESMMADVQKLEQVIINLVNNAIKYSPKGSNVDCEVSATANEIRFSIIDNGPGIPVHEKDKIFEEFYRAEDVKPEIASGFGLGLHIAKQIVTLHKGQIGIESEVGSGSTFWFTIPRYFI